MRLIAENDEANLQREIDLSDKFEGQRLQLEARVEALSLNLA